MLVAEKYRKQHCYNESIAGKDVPTCLPALQHISNLGVKDKMVHHFLGRKHSHGGTKSIGHHHKQALGRVAYVEVCLSINKERTRDVKEVEGYAVDNHREDDENKTASGVANSEEAKTEHPGKHGHKHYLLDAKTTQAEGNEQDAEGLAHL